MMGLLIKDFKLLKCQIRGLFIILVTFIALTNTKNNTVAMISYLACIGVIFAVSTASFDEYDNGNLFLFSLPITRKGYVLEKYGFALIVGGGAWLFATVFTMAVGTIRNTISVEEGIFNALLVLAVSLVMISVMYPLQFAFGSEKRTIALFVIVAIIMVIGVAISKLALAFNVDLLEIIYNLPQASIGVIVAAALAISVVMLAVSCLISMGIMRRKEF
jgi:ABC-type transport system involved in multi-copper enzyme maturation permease subunit